MKIFHSGPGTPRKATKATDARQATPHDDSLTYVAEKVGECIEVARAEFQVRALTRLVDAQTMWRGDCTHCCWICWSFNIEVMS